jgi:hypothetical protein
VSKTLAGSFDIDREELQAYGFSVRQGIDNHFIEEAEAFRKPIIGLETNDYQINFNILAVFRSIRRGARQDIAVIRYFMPGLTLYVSALFFTPGKLAIYGRWRHSPAIAVQILNHRSIEKKLFTKENSG